MAKCGFAQSNTIYAITASNAFFIWSTTDDDQQLLVQGDTDNDSKATGIPNEQIDAPAKSSSVIHHLPSTYSTIVDILTDNNIKDLLPSVLQETKVSWPLLMCDHMGKMSITLISSEECPPMILPLHSPHSETIRAAVAHHSSLYTCADDGQVIQWQAPSSNNSNKNSQATKPNNKKPY